MANLKEVRIRITSVTSTQQITKAMKLVSATKLRRAQNAITLMRPYATKLNGILSNLSDSIDVDSLKIFFDERPVKNVLLVVITSDRGLCGSFNANVIKMANKTINEKYNNQKEIRKHGIIQTILSNGTPNITLSWKSTLEMGRKARTNNKTIVVKRSRAKGSFLKFNDVCIFLNF